MLGLLGPVWLSTRKTWLALPPWTSLALKARLRTRILFNNNAPTTKSHSPEAWGWGFLRGIECPSGWGPHACDQPSLLGGDGASVDLKEFIHLPFRINFPHFPFSTRDKELLGLVIKKKCLSRVCKIHHYGCRCYSKKGKKEKKKQTTHTTSHSAQLVSFVNILYLK